MVTLQSTMTIPDFQKAIAKLPGAEYDLVVVEPHNLIVSANILKKLAAILPQTTPKQFMPKLNTKRELERIELHTAIAGDTEEEIKRRLKGRSRIDQYGRFYFLTKTDAPQDLRDIEMETEKPPQFRTNYKKGDFGYVSFYVQPGDNCLTVEYNTESGVNGKMKLKTPLDGPDSTVQNWGFAPDRSYKLSDKTITLESGA